ncbi:META domain-containing protein [Flavobacterium cerinum]|uniref:META domain-containing protein n=1 Tax=Flavobacterium cerinum TaxID=2502784 RepID=A0ABY5IY31_9FLAO|nr:META domain-containing protein [Flavobacterium cerinum]UUC47195.1 META domain-containing protein [Flavobacterium cerinum]
MKKVTLSLLAVALVSVGCNTYKKSDTTVALEGTKWKLVELRGKPVSKTEMGKDVYLQLDQKEHRVSGFSGCNGFGGTYTLKDGNRIELSQMMGTLMACPDLETETAFLEVLRTVDNYNHNGKTLQLNKARMAPLAKFEAVK